MAAVARSTVLVVALTIILAACSDDDAVTTTTAVASTSPAVTHTMAPTLGEASAWEPAHQISADLETSLAALLRSRLDAASLCSPDRGTDLSRTQYVDPGKRPDDGHVSPCGATGRVG